MICYLWAGKSEVNAERSGESYLEVGVEGRLGRVDDEVSQREAESLRVLLQDHRPWAQAHHTLPRQRPRPLIGR